MPDPSKFTYRTKTHELCCVLDSGKCIHLIQTAVLQSIMQMTLSSCYYWSVILPLVGIPSSPAFSADAFVLPGPRSIRAGPTKPVFDPLLSNAQRLAGPILAAVSSDSNNELETLASSAELEDLDAAMSSPSSPLPTPLWEKALTKVGSTTSALVAGTFFLSLAYHRDALMVSFFIGAISNGILSKVLKKLLKQERPVALQQTADTMELPPSDNGMPSSHAMSLGFIGTFTALQLPQTTLPIILYVAISLVYRVRSNLHSLEQVVVGVTLGSTNGYLWKTSCLPSVMEFVTWHFLNDQGVLPWVGLAAPALVGAAVVGSVERRISRMMEEFSKDD